MYLLTRILALAFVAVTFGAGLVGASRLIRWRGLRGLVSSVALLGAPLALGWTLLRESARHAAEGDRIAATVGAFGALLGVIATYWVTYNLGELAATGSSGLEETKPFGGPKGATMLFLGSIVGLAVALLADSLWIADRVQVARMVLALFSGLLTILSFGALIFYGLEGTRPEEREAASIAAYRQGDIAGAIAIARGLIAQRPTDFRGYLNMGIFVRQLALTTANPGALTESLRLLTKASELATGVNRAIALGNVGTTHLEMGNFTAAAKAMEEAFAASGRIFYRIRAAYCLARQGFNGRAVEGVAQLSEADVRQADLPSGEGLSCFNVGVIHALAGNATESVRWLALAAAIAPGRYDQSFVRDTDLDLIRKSAAFAELMRSRAIGPEKG